MRRPARGSMEDLSGKLWGQLVWFRTSYDAQPLATLHCLALVRRGSAVARPYDADADPALADVCAEPGRAAHVRREHIPALLGNLEQIKAALWSRLMAPGGDRTPVADTVEDKLLTVEEAAEKLSVTVDWLYRHAARLPFTVRPGPRQLRFSLRGIERYIRQRQGR